MNYCIAKVKIHQARTECVEKTTMCKLFWRILLPRLKNHGILSHFNNEFKVIFDNRTPLKIMKPPGNTKPHINNTIKKEIMKESWLKNKLNKTGLVKVLKLYKIQQNAVTKLNKNL